MQLESRDMPNKVGSQSPPLPPFRLPPLVKRFNVPGLVVVVPGLVVVVPGLVVVVPGIVVVVPGFVVVVPGLVVVVPGLVVTELVCGVIVVEAGSGLGGLPAVN